MATWKKVVIESAADTIAQDTTGNAGTATALENARTIGGVSFDGTANINLPGVNTAGDQNTSGNAATATALANARDITLSGDVSGSASFDGSANITITATVADDSHNHTIANVDGLQTALDAKQAADADLTAIAGLSSADGNFIVGSASGWVAESGATARNSLGLGSLATKSAIATGDITNGTILEADLNVTNTPTAGHILSYASSGGGFTWVANTAAANNSTITLSPGPGIGTLGAFDTNQSSPETITIGVDGVLEDLDTLGAAASDGQFIVATGAGAFAYESGDTVRTSMGLGTSDSPSFSGLTVNGNLTVTGTTTTVESTNLLVDDTFISLNDNASANADTGIVFGGADNKVFGWDHSQESGRFGVDYAGGNAATSGGGFDPDGWVSVTHTNTAAPDDATNGDTDSLRQIGNIYVNSTNQDIYIYS